MAVKARPLPRFAIDALLQDTGRFNVLTAAQNEIGHALPLAGFLQRDLGHLVRKLLLATLQEKKERRGPEVCKNETNKKGGQRRGQ